jgi:hypothetical protein
VKLLALAELIPLVFMGATAQAPPSCAEQRPTKEASVTTASRTPEVACKNWKYFKIAANKS